MLGNGLVSTIIPVFNRAAMLPEAVASVLAQSYRPIEIIVVDDGSTDATPSVVSALVKEHPDMVFGVTQKNAGPGAARNLGLQSARGEFIQYLDSDDLLLPQKFEWQVAALRTNPDAGLCYGRTSRLNLVTGTSRPWARTGEFIQSIFPDFLPKRGWDTNAPLWRRSACDRIGPWLSLRCMEDWEHDLRAGMLGVVPTRIEAEVAIIRDHGGSRASGADTGFTPALTRDFFLAHEHVVQRMKADGLIKGGFLAGFSRKLFWIARMCGERGLHDEAQRALEMAEVLAEEGGVSRRDIGVFKIAVKLFGWRLSCGVAAHWRGLMRSGGDMPSLTTESAGAVSRGQAG